MAHVFLSYARADEAYVAKLAAAIRKNGIDVWMDSEIDYGAEWPKVIEQHLDGSVAVVLVMSETSRESGWVRKELTRAQRKNIDVFPVLLSGEPWLELETVQYADVRDSSLPDASFYASLGLATRDSVRSARPNQRSGGPVETHRIVAAMAADDIEDRRDALIHRIYTEIKNLRVSPSERDLQLPSLTDRPPNDHTLITGPSDETTRIRRIADSQYQAYWTTSPLRIDRTKLGMVGASSWTRREMEALGWGSFATLSMDYDALSWPDSKEGAAAPLVAEAVADAHTQVFNDDPDTVVTELVTRDRWTFPFTEGDAHDQ